MSHFRGPGPGSHLMILGSRVLGTTFGVRVKASIGSRVSGTTFLWSLLCIVLVFQKIEAHSFIHALFLVPEWPYWPLNCKGFTFYYKKYIKGYSAWNAEFRVLKFQIHLSQNIISICCDIFSESMVICLHLKHVLIFIIDISISQNVFNF